MIRTRTDQQGLSMLETLITLALALLMSCIVFPAVGAAFEQVRAARAETEFSGALLLSARHAVAGGAATVLCPLASGTGCGEGTDWSGGWLAFADLDNDRQFGPGDTLLLRAQPLTGGLRLYGPRERARIVFHPQGGSAGSNATFIVCGARHRSLGALVLSNAGQFRWTRNGSAGADKCLNH